MFLSPRVLINNLHIKNTDKVLDLGSGAGSFAYEIMRKLGDSGKLLCVDNNKDLLELIQKSAIFEGKIIDTLLSDLNHKILLPDLFFDYIILANTYNHIENKDMLINECYRLLSPTGKLLFVDWDNNNHIKINSHYENKDTVLNSFSKYKFRYLKDLPAGDYHHAILFGK